MSLCCCSQKVNAIEFWKQRLATAQDFLNTFRRWVEQEQVESAGVAFVSFESSSAVVEFLRRHNRKAIPMLTRGVQKTVGISNESLLEQDSLSKPLTADLGAEFVLRAPKAAVNALTSDNKWDLKMASAPKDYIWENLSAQRKMQGVGSCITITVVVFVALFWAVPITLLRHAKLGSSSSLLRNVTTGYLPAVLVLLVNSLLPVAIAVLVQIEKAHTKSQVRLSVMTKYYGTRYPLPCIL